ncbi:uncharacterized protein F4822DRAFT_427510 [Hypoxylon trugodes]|uniref:uncharacterized protein n=1 Tax=Hypoxylon trugodes TaxID=326681 RepID=UPI002194D5F2|nr:uncharacterized protein F4822DRAFT_427510 [Hypoxylon trugodes]KAI1391654.1 hypothetical protein F4822DRAFT_427510 [Hypoxylon trugodes]
MPPGHPRYGSLRPSGQVKKQDIRDDMFDGSLSPDAQAFVDYFERGPHNFPIGINTDDVYGIPTPQYFQGWDQEVKQEQLGNQSLGHIAGTIEPSENANNAVAVRRSGRHSMAPRDSFPKKIPPMTQLATDFKDIPSIPGDVPLWCPCCDRLLLEECFKAAPASQVPMETCADCRKERFQVPAGLKICWSDPSEYKGCGRLLPLDRFSGFHNHETNTGIFCRDCRTFGHSRARFEGRYTYKK